MNMKINQIFKHILANFYKIKQKFNYILLLINQILYKIGISLRNNLNRPYTQLS